MKLKTRLSLLLIVFLALNSCKKKQKIVKIMYSDLQAQISNYRKKGFELFAEDVKLASSYLNDSIYEIVRGTYISDYNFNLANGSILNTDSIQKPIYLQVGSRSCAPCRAEIPALNDIVEKYSDDISFILLSQYDSKEALLKVLHEYHQDISLVYYSKEENKNNKQSDPGKFSGFKHLMKSLPRNYLVNKNRQIVGITGGAIVPGSHIDTEGKEITITKEKAYQENYKKFEKEIEFLLKDNLE